MGNNPKFRSGIRIVAGAYLIYLAYQVIRDGFFRGELDGSSYKWLALIGAVLFIVVGILLAIQGSKELSRIQKEERELAAKEAAEEAAQRATSTQSFREYKNLEVLDDEEYEDEDGGAEDAEDAGTEDTEAEDAGQDIAEPVSEADPEQ